MGSDENKKSPISQTKVHPLDTEEGNYEGDDMLLDDDQFAGHLDDIKVVDTDRSKEGTDAKGSQENSSDLDGFSSQVDQFYSRQSPNSDKNKNKTRYENKKSESESLKYETFETGSSDEEEEKKDYYYQLADVDE